MENQIIYKPIVSSLDIAARDEIIAYLKKQYGINDIKPHMVKFRILDENGELLKNPAWEFDLDEYLKDRPKNIFQRIKKWFTKK